VRWWVGARHSGSMATPTASSAAGLIAWGSDTAQALDPSQLANLEIEIPPALAALSFLTSRTSFWEVHALVVGFAMDMVGAADPDRVMAELSNKESISQWVQDQEFQRYVDHQDVETGNAGLIMSAMVIDNALTADALRSAQFSSTKIRFCQIRCNGRPPCVLRCLAE
jgi:hypothetical protein